jgi:hypothetical protein
MEGQYVVLAREIVDYFEWQGHETVVHLEKVASERVHGVRYDVWDVHAKSGERWWVLTNPTNLYSQTDFPSQDYILSFHIGLSARLLARREAPASDEEQNRLAAAWRRCQQGAEALDRAEEAEDFQAVGMRCRECLIELVRGVASPDMVPLGVEAPKRADFIHWAELIANAIAGGRSASELRGYMKAVSRAAWQYVNWLTHATGSARRDGELAVDMTQHVLSVFGRSLLRHEHGGPDRCPRCGSYQLARVHRPDMELEDPYATVCARCEWTDAPSAPPRPRSRPTRRRVRARPH